MPSKTVSDDVFRRIVVAIQVIEQDPNLKRTKREIERLSGLSHDAVARAFRQDAAAGTAWTITDRFNALAKEVSGGNSPAQQAVAELETKLQAERKTNRELEKTLNAYATALYALYMNHREQQEARTHSPGDPVPIGKNRTRKR